MPSPETGTTTSAAISTGYIEEQPNRQETDSQQPTLRAFAADAVTAAAVTVAAERSFSYEMGLQVIVLHRRT